MQICRACYLEGKRRYGKERTQNDPVFREKRRLYAAKYYAENKDVHNMKHSIYMREYRKRQKENVA